MGELFPLDPRAVADAVPDLVLGPDEDVRAHAGLGNHRVIGLSFPKWRDGRPYSAARILREAGYAGDIRAIGDLTVDQLVFLKRSGFSSVETERPIDPAVAARALERFQFVYQRGTDDPRNPAWVLRQAGPAA